MSSHAERGRVHSLEQAGPFGAPAYILGKLAIAGREPANNPPVAFTPFGTFACLRPARIWRFGPLGLLTRAAEVRP